VRERRGARYLEHSDGSPDPFGEGWVVMSSADIWRKFLRIKDDLHKLT